MSPLLDPRLDELLTQADDLPTLPLVALEVLRLCRAEETTLDDLARTLSADPALAARLLRFANSSLYSSGEEVRTLQRATLVLGMKTVQLMSLSFSLMSAVPRVGTAGAFDYGLYWRRSLVRAVSARGLAGCTGLAAQDEAFLAGLLGEIGQVVLARGLASTYEPVLAEASKRRCAWPSAALERELLGFDHLDVGGALLRSWQLPGVLELAVRCAGNLAGLAPETPAEAVQLVHVLGLAAEVTDVFTLTDAAGSLGRAQDLARCWFGLEKEALGMLLMALEDPIRETAGLLELALPPGRSHARILDDARAELRRRGPDPDPGLRSGLPPEPAHVDELTGGANLAAFQLVLTEEIRARAAGNRTRPLGLLLIELDSFAALAGEELRSAAQRTLGECLARLTRKQDVAARIRPGCFAFLLGDATPFGLRALVERLRGELAAQPLAPGAGVPGKGVSIGGACLGRVKSLADGAALHEVVERLLARARLRGACQTEVHGTLLQPR